MKTVKTQKQFFSLKINVLLLPFFSLPILTIIKFIHPVYSLDNACKMLHSYIYTSHIIHLMA